MADNDIVNEGVARDVLGHFGEKGGWHAGGFTEALLALISKADMHNKRRLAEGFPEHVTAMILAQETPNGIERLQKIAGVI